mgnify:CR=1 FL=1
MSESIYRAPAFADALPEHAAPGATEERLAHLQAHGFVIISDFVDSSWIPLLREALDIWLAEMPAIPLLQFYHRLPHNQTNWTNWPSQENPYINSAYWHRTWLLVLLNLKPVH